LGWVGLAFRVGLGWVGLGWVGLGWVGGSNCCWFVLELGAFDTETANSQGTKPLHKTTPQSHSTKPIPQKTPRPRTLKQSDFTFYADRLNRLVVEAGGCWAGLFKSV